MNTSFYGRLTRDPEIKTPQSGGNPYAQFSVATQMRSKGQDGKYKSAFITCVAFGRSADILSQYFHKGSRIVVHGEVNDIGAWIGNQDNQPHASVSITVTGFDFVDTQAESQQTQAPATSYQQRTTAPAYTAAPEYAAPPAQTYTAPPAQTYAAPPAQGFAAPPAAPPQAPAQAPSYPPQPGQPGTTHSPF